MHPHIPPRPTAPRASPLRRIAVCIAISIAALAASIAAPAWWTLANAADATSRTALRTPVPLRAHLWLGDAANFPVVITPRHAGPSGAADDLRDGPAPAPWNADIGAAITRGSPRHRVIDHARGAARVRASAIRGPPRHI